MRQPSEIIPISSRKFLALCGSVAVILYALGQFVRYPSWFIAAEVFITVIALFTFGSVRWRIDKNALTYGAGFVIGATFFTVWWPQSGLKQALSAEGIPALVPFIQRNFLNLRALEQLIHADTMLFILGITFFVSVIAQTRILETVSFIILNKARGALFPTVALIAGLVSFSSGILDGVSMIGLMIRTFIIILFLAKVRDENVYFAVVVSTVITTVCGMWLAYGEPPNLIMKANLHPLLNDAFFLKYCLPAALGSYVVVLFNLWHRLRGFKVNVKTLDILETHDADVKFAQAARHGEVFIAAEFVQRSKNELGDYFDPLMKRIQQGESLGEAMLRSGVPASLRKPLFGRFVSEDLVDALDDHFSTLVRDGQSDAGAASQKIANAFKHIRTKRRTAQIFSGLSFIPFVGFLVLHAVNHHFPLFVAPFAGFFVAVLGIATIKKMRRLAIREALHEYAEYIFLLPLFLSISLLQRSGFFEEVGVILRNGVALFGAAHVAAAQFFGATFLSAMLDNNVVADFGSRALHGLEMGTIYLFSLAQIAGYATGGCWTHIGSAQSVVAYSFIHKQLDHRFTPLKWIKLMTPVVLEISIFLIIWVYFVGWLHTPG